MKKLGSFVKKHRLLLQSSAIFPSWLIAFYASLSLLIGVPLMLVASNTLLTISTVATLIALLTIAILTIKEKKMSYIGWFSLTIALVILLFAIPNGIQLIFLVIATAAMAVLSYLGFAYGEIPSLRVYTFGIILLLVFLPYVYILHSPQSIGIPVKGNEVTKAFTKMMTKELNMPPLKFIKTDGGRNLAIKAYHVSPFISDAKLQTIIKRDPKKLIEVRHSLLSTPASFKRNPYMYILNVYLGMASKHYILSATTTTSKSNPHMYITNGSSNNINNNSKLK